MLHGRRELLEAMRPFLGGGDMIGRVDFDTSTWNELPWKFEAGTSPIAEAIGLGAAIDYLAGIGMERVRAHERDLTAYALERLPEVEGLRIFGPLDAERRGGVVSFALEGIHPHDIAELCDREAVCIRAGHHCAQPLMRQLGVPATARASFHVYNSRADVDRLVDGAPAGARGLRALMDELYRDYILDHYKSPHNFGTLEPHDLEWHDHNPLCGDELGVHIVVGDDGKIADLRFHGQGCAISQAAASITSDELIGMPVDEVRKLGADWVIDLLGIDISPTRRKCALLSLKVMRGATTGDASWPEDDEACSRRSQPRCWWRVVACWPAVATTSSSACACRARRCCPPTRSASSSTVDREAYAARPPAGRRRGRVPRAGRRGDRRLRLAAAAQAAVRASDPHEP